MDRIDRERAEACMLGVAIGDSLGLAYEGLPRQRGTKLYPFPLRQRLFLGTGFLSDDTLQSALVLNALGQSLDPKEFQRALAFNLRSWFLCLPPGIGMATIRACLKLTVGVSPTKSGVNSGGNGAAMRSAVIGAALHSAVEARIALAETSARITHTHPLAIQGAQLVSLAAALSAQGNEHLFEQQARALVPDWQWQTPWPETGPTGYVVHTVN
ncbi:MAG: ADP-ribosylglycohydrolase family protein, partial [Armatimonadota bacterium]